MSASTTLYDIDGREYRLDHEKDGYYYVTSVLDANWHLSSQQKTGMPIIRIPKSELFEEPPVYKINEQIKTLEMRKTKLTEELTNFQRQISFAKDALNKLQIAQT